jgi:hypothetical protein
VQASELAASPHRQLLAVSLILSSPVLAWHTLIKSVALPHFISPDYYPHLSRFQLRGKELTFSVVLLSIDIPSLHLHHVANVLAKQVSIMKSALRSLPLSMSLSPNNRILSLYIEICRHQCRTTASRARKCPAA